MEFEQINKIEKLQKEYNKLIEELKQLKNKLNELQEQYKIEENKYSKLDLELNDSEEKYETIRIVKKEKEYIKTKINEKLKTIVTISTAIFPLLIIILNLLILKNIPLIIVSSIISFFIGPILGKLIFNKNKNKFTSKFKRDFENTNEYRDYLQFQESKKEKRKRINNKKDNSYKKCSELKKEYNNIYRLVLEKIQQIDNFKNLAVSSIFNDEELLDKIKEEVTPRKFSFYNTVQEYPKVKKLKNNLY